MLVEHQDDWIIVGGTDISEKDWYSSSRLFHLRCISNEIHNFITFLAATATTPTQIKSKMIQSSDDDDDDANVHYI